MKLKLSIISALIVALAAMAAVVSPAAEAAKPGTGSVTEPITGTIDGQTIENGSFTITRFAVVDGALTAVGTFTGTIGGETERVATTAQVLQVTGTCQILELTLGPLDLDVLGLVIELDQVHLEITAEQGPGNLLGNLLCAVAGLLDGPIGGGGGLSGLLNQIVTLLNQILGQLGG